MYKGQQKSPAEAEEKKPDDLIRERRELMVQVSAIDTELAKREESQGLVSPETRVLLTQVLRIALPGGHIDSKEAEDIVKNSLYAVEHVIGMHETRRKNAAISKAICENNPWVKEIESPSLTAQEYKELKDAYSRRKPLLPWAISFVWSTSGDPTKNLYDNMESAPNDVVRGKHIVAFMCNPENQKRGSGFCKALWTAVKEERLFASENPTALRIRITDIIGSSPSYTRSDSSSSSSSSSSSASSSAGSSSSSSSSSPSGSPTMFNERNPKLRDSRTSEELITLNDLRLG